MNYSAVPQKVTQQYPVYSNTCPKCKSDNTCPLMNIIGAMRQCNRCINRFSPTIVRYETRVVEEGMPIGY